MKPLWILLAMLLAAGNAGAQMYKWVDKDGKVRYGDTPPAGAKTSSVKAPQSGATAPAPATTGGKDAKKGPLTPAEQEQEYRKRQVEAGEAAEKAATERREKAERLESCERNRDYLRTLTSGQRITRTGPGGERYFLDETQVAQEVSKAQQAVQQACR